MKKYFLGLCWNEKYKPYIHLKDYESGLDEFIDIPQELLIERINQKICIGTINPYTREYISCNNIIEDSSSQCNHCKFMFDFYKCVRCHGDDCYVKNGDVLKYCNTPHYVYLAYFPNGKIKVGTASEIKKYNRLLEQGAIFSIFIAKTPTGKIARQIEKNIIDNGITGAVTTTYKMKNIVFDSEEKLIRKELIEKYKDILKLFAGDNKKYLIEPEFNSFNEIKDKLVYGKDVSAVKNYVETSEVDLGIVYKSDSLDLKSSQVVLEIPKNLHENINYTLAPINSSEDGKKIIEFINSKYSKEILREYGFLINE